ncbi:MAG: hypothetical protein COV45_08685 [Deltaproteobacteria bacterium CG11_big_fil_rev_8_21_14_0_20_47_16]|nr:MAG: hypothetical protein COV45_08685 [Deltaproteobacteria bacterium CG11_big_fil_rev_8_21_14_0_20_47_16]
MAKNDHLQTALSLIQTADLLIFDFDGTLVDSNELKWTAFETCFDDYPNYRNQIRTYSRTKNHVLRHDKLRHICENILGETCPPEREQQLLNRYNEETTLGIIAAPEIPGATQFLDFMFGKKHMVLLSATPHDILISLVKERKLERYFEHIQGAPINKADWMKTYIDQSGMKHAVSIGDSKEDALSAQKISLPFIPIGHDIPNAFPNYYNLMQPQLIP